MSEPSDAELCGLIRIWLPGCRWYAGKQAPISAVRLAGRVSLGDAAGCLLWVDVAAEGDTGPPARYQLPVRLGAGGVELDAFTLPEARQAWFELLASGTRRPGPAGVLSFEPLGANLEAASSRALGAEQSNTSLLYADAAGRERWVLKLFRRLQAGENPDFELPRALAQTGFQYVPAPAGRVRLEQAGVAYTLATLQAFIPNQGDGWSYLLDRLGESPVPPAGLTAEIAALGRRTAALHRALAQIPAPGFAPSPIGPATLDHWRARARAGAASPALRPFASLLAPWLRYLDSRLPSGLEPLADCAQIRIHGDYHLGQVLRTAGDFYIFDFEGEPARPLAERRRPGCVLQDVAGMLRSFAYAAHAGRRPGWEPEARAAFLEAYRAALAMPPALGCTLVPAEAAGFAAALAFFETEKAVYELAYELAHRPAWVPIPLAALTRITAAL